MLARSAGTLRPAGVFEGVFVEIEIGIAKSGRRAWGFDDIAIVPSRRTRDPHDVDLSWQLDAYKFDLPMMASAMDSAVSPRTAVEIGRLVDFLRDHRQAVRCENRHQRPG